MRIVLGRILALAEQWELLGAIAPRPLLVLNALHNQPAFEMPPGWWKIFFRINRSDFSNMMYDDVIMRTIIDLPENQVRALAELCELEKISRAEAVRRALAEMLARKQSLGREQAFGVWKSRGDSRKIVEDLRREWES